MVGLVPIKAAAARDKDALLMQQVERELLVVGNIELLDIHLGEDVKRSLGLHRGDAIDGVQRLVHVVALLVHAAARHDVARHALVASERRLHDGLRGHV